MIDRIRSYFSKQDLFVLIGLVFIFIILFSLCFVSDGSQGGADSFVHYRISRFAFKYPHLFFDHWGKPLFVMLSAPLAQLGFTGIRTFNILVGIVSAWFVYKSALKLKLKTAWAAIIFALASPLYTSILLSGLTEPLFGLVLIMSIYFFLSEKYILSAIILSLIPFARTEGFIFFPIFGLAYAMKKQWKSIPFLLTGFALFSIAGYPVFGDLLWVIHNSPYTGAEDVYGSGSFWHFFEHSELIFGLPLLIIGTGGLLYIVLKWVFKYEDINNFMLLLLIPGTILAYFMAHTVVWFLGMNGSLGLTRVITGVVPVMGLSGVLAMESLFFSNKSKYLGHGIAAVFVVWSLALPFSTTKFPVKLGVEETVLKAATDYMYDNDLEDKYIVYYNPIVGFFLDLDPFGSTRSREQVVDREFPEKGIPSDAIVVWDAHFGPNEGGLPIEKLMENPHFEFIQSFDPEYPFTVLGGHQYQVYLFRKK